MIYFAAAIGGMILQALFIAVEHKEKYVPAVILKGSASAAFVVLGLLTSAKSTDGAFASSVVTGLILGAIGDILLNLRFVFPKLGSPIFLLGIAVFLSGHIMYLCALIPLSQNLTTCIIAGVVATILLLIWIFSRITAKTAFKAFGVVYIGAIVIMTCVAIGNLITNPSSASMLLYVIGAVAFTVSDVILIMNTFGGESRFSLRIANLSFYYLGQLLIAFSLFCA